MATLKVESEKATKLTEFWNKMEGFQRGSRNSAAYIFSSRAQQVIADAYAKQADGSWNIRIGVDTTNADKLVEMGYSEAVMGRGRSMLRK